MKINKYILLLSATMVVASCDLDKFPEGSTVTQDQKNEVVELLPDRISSELNGLKTGLYSHTNLLTDYNNHMDYGFPAACMIYETAGQDLLTLNDQTGYNKFISSQRLLDRNITSTFNAFLWKLYYKHMKTANDILKAIPADATDAALKKYRGQALASRAFDYLQLIQTYQLTYIGHETANGVPLVLETTSDTELMNNPRASVQQVYSRIMEDLDEAITLLTGASARADKAEISVEVAYGLRARANLLMGKWSAAASDAAKAYGTSAPYSIADVSQPTFYNATDNSWIWGIVVTTEDYLAKTGIVNWPSNLCSLTGMGYTTAASATDVAYRLINKNLWAKIPETDVRKGWWVDEDLHSPVLDNGLGEDYAYYWANGMFNGGTFPSKFSPYTNVKFGPDNGTFADTDNAQDWPLMRVEEMKLIEAEALGRDNLAAGKQKLEEFVRQYRDPSYTCTAGSLDAFIDEVWFQRRVELWGEGFALFDILRLKKPIIRQGANYPINSTFAEIAAEAPIMIYRIPEAETSVNSAITEADNNPAAMAPTPVN
nr:RagB/SusD family nutrient uptake outer membrane protein [Bacteroides intestinalis]